MLVVQIVSSFYPHTTLMDNQHINRGRTWKVLCWNMREINSSSKWNSIRNKIKDNSCDIVCLQETKRESFDQAYIRNFCPPGLDNFNYINSVGASGGAIIIWKGSRFNDQTIFSE
jgi:exonuclease III